MRAVIDMNMTEMAGIEEGMKMMIDTINKVDETEMLMIESVPIHHRLEIEIIIMMGIEIEVHQEAGIEIINQMM